jgi:hypothetical protein
MMRSTIARALLLGAAANATALIGAVIAVSR